MLDKFDELLWRGLVMMALVVGAIALGWQLAKVHLLLALLYAPVAFFLIGAIHALVLQRLFARDRTRVEVMGLLRAFLDGTATDSDWNLFTMLRIADPRLEAIRLRLIAEGPATPTERAPVIRACLEELHKEGA